MKELLLVTAREIKVRGRTKSYLIGIAVSSLLVAALALLPRFFDDPNTDQLGVVGPALDAGSQVEIIDFDDRAAAETALRAGDVGALLVDSKTIVTANGLDPQLGLLLKQAHQAASSPQSTVTQVFSMIPPFSAMVMPVRFAAGQVPLQQLAASWVLMLAAATGVVLLAARIYRRAVLRTGARLKLSQLWR